MRQWKPDRAELSQAGFKIVKKTACLIDMRDRVDMYVCLVLEKEEQEGGNDQQTGDDSNKQVIASVPGQGHGFKLYSFAYLGRNYPVLHWNAEGNSLMPGNLRLVHPVL